MNHIGISVADLQRSLQFYRDILAMRVVVEAEFEGEQYEAILGLNGARGKVVLLQGAEGMQVELFEFVHPAPEPADPNYPVSNHRISHFCLEVSDIDAEYERMKAAGVVFHCPPLSFFGTAKATYGRDPDGNVFELLELLRPE